MRCLEISSASSFSIACCSAFLHPTIARACIDCVPTRGLWTSALESGLLPNLPLIALPLVVMGIITVVVHRLGEHAYHQHEGASQGDDGHASSVRRT